MNLIIYSNWNDISVVVVVGFIWIQNPTKESDIFSKVSSRFIHIIWISYGILFFLLLLLFGSICTWKCDKVLHMRIFGGRKLEKKSTVSIRIIVVWLWFKGRSDHLDFHPTYWNCLQNRFARVCDAIFSVSLSLSFLSQRYSFHVKIYIFEPHHMSWWNSFLFHSMNQPKKWRYSNNLYRVNRFPSRKFMCLLNCHVQTGPPIYRLNGQIVNLHIWVQLYSLNRVTSLAMNRRRKKTHTHL